MSFATSSEGRRALGQPDGLLLHGEAARSDGLLRPEGLADMLSAANGMPCPSSCRTGWPPQL
jgi:hypothetical protein